MPAKLVLIWFRLLVGWKRFCLLSFFFYLIQNLKFGDTLKTVISASRRTDIPAYYLNWFMAGIKAGRIEVKNPFYRHKSIIVNLNPTNVGWIVFWSRNYARFIEAQPFFEEYRLFFHFTIVSHHPLLEKTSVSVSDALSQMEKMVVSYGADLIIWRYDPIVIWADKNELHTNFNETEFEFLTKSISALGITKCYFSFCTPYRKYQNRIQKKYPDWILQNSEIDLKKNSILQSIRIISENSTIQLFSCCNDTLIGDGIKKGACISGHLLNSLSGKKIVSEAKSPSRPDCGCTRAIDIGDYQTQPCYTGCIYCYANPVM
jgi:hypothetical protein